MTQFGLVCIVAALESSTSFFQEQRHSWLHHILSTCITYWVSTPVWWRYPTYLDNWNLSPNYLNSSRGVFWAVGQTPGSVTIATHTESSQARMFLHSHELLISLRVALYIPSHSCSIICQTLTQLMTIMWCVQSCALLLLSWAEAKKQHVNSLTIVRMYNQMHSQESEPKYILFYVPKPIAYVYLCWLGLTGSDFASNDCTKRPQMQERTCNKCCVQQGNVNSLWLLEHHGLTSFKPWTLRGRTTCCCTLQYETLFVGPWPIKASHRLLPLSSPQRVMGRPTVLPCPQC